MDSLTTCSRIHYTPITVSLKDSVLTLGPAYLAEASTTTLLPSHVIFPCCTCVGIPLGYCSAFSNWLIIHLVISIPLVRSPLPVRNSQPSGTLVIILSFKQLSSSAAIVAIVLKTFTKLHQENMTVLLVTVDSCMRID